MHDSLLQLKIELAGNSELRNKFQKCPLCGHIIADRHVALYKGLIEALYRVYVWCGQHQRHEFETKNIKHLLSKNDYARFGDLIRFGGLVYKPKDEDNQTRKAWFGLNMARAKEFFAGKRKIPVQIVLNQITNEIVSANYITVKEFPYLWDFLTKEGLYDYEKRISIPQTLF